jgi:hypothetical protein
MKNIINNITEKLKNGIITVEEANDLLLNIFYFIKGNSMIKIVCYSLGLISGFLLSAMLFYLFSLLNT